MTHTDDIDLKRRRILCAALAATAITFINPRSLAVGQDLENYHGGLVNPPLPVPDFSVRCADGSFKNLASLLKGRTTALQLIFTQCTTTCPIQGATFQHVQRLLPDQIKQSLQLLSLSIDPIADKPKALQAWLERFHGRRGWIAASPRIEDLLKVQSFFGDRGKAIENHATQVQIIDRRGNLVWRTYEMPPPDYIAELLRKIRS